MPLREFLEKLVEMFILSSRLAVQQPQLIEISANWQMKPLANLQRICLVGVAAQYWHC